MLTALARRLKTRKNHNSGIPHHAGRGALASVMESFEPRLLFAYCVVNTMSDDTAADNVLSLREAVALVENGGDANAALGRSLTAGELSQINLSQPYGTSDTIVFNNSVAGGTINMGSHLVINNRSAVTIDGGSGGLTLSGGPTVATWRAFDVSDAGNLTLKHLTLNHFGNVGGSTSGQGTIAGDGAGGAIYNNSGTVTIDNCTFSNNSVQGGSSDGQGSIAGRGTGGAIYSDSGTLTIGNSTFSNNSARGGSSNGPDDVSGSGNGGAIYFNAGTLSIYNCAFGNNSVRGGSASGQGSVAQSGDGGAIYSGTGFSFSPPPTVVNVANSTMNGNTATGSGGAIYNSGATFHLSFSTVSGNTANAGRAVYLSSGRPGGPGNPSSPTATIDNSILGQSDNSAADLMLETSHSDFGGMVNLSGSHNLIRNTSATGITYSSADPLLGTLQDNGGPTQTMALQASDPGGGFRR